MMEVVLHRQVLREEIRKEARREAAERRAKERKARTGAKARVSEMRIILSKMVIHLSEFYKLEWMILALYV